MEGQRVMSFFSISVLSETLVVSKVERVVAMAVTLNEIFNIVLKENGEVKTVGIDLFEKDYTIKISKSKVDEKESS